MAALSAAAAAPWLNRAHAAAAEKRPNLLVILADDLNYRSIGCTGNAEVRTPVIDGIAAEGTRFSHCFVSNPICTPSRACIQTGQYGFTNGVTFFGQPINPESPRLARILTDAGYTCGYTGKWHNDGRPGDHGYAKTRNVFLGGMHGYEDIPVVQGAEDPKVVLQGNPTTIFTDGAIELLTHDLPEPWCLFVCYTAPHDPRTPLAEFEAQYPPESITLPANYMPEPPFDTGTLDIRDEKLLPRPLDPEALRVEWSRYYAMITHMDEQIGRIIDHLKASGAWDTTTTLFAGDHGLTLGSHGLLGKQTLYEEGIRTPLIVKGPGVRSGVVSPALVDLMDIMPTCCAMAGAAIPEAVEAKDITPICTGKTTTGRNAIFSHYEDLFRMIRTDRYKLISHLKTDREELFDLDADPFERNDRSEDDTLADTKANLRHQLDQFRQME